MTAYTAPPEARWFKSVPDNFRKNAKPVRHQRRRHRAISRLLGGLPGKALDYGCGFGDITYLISRTHPVTGCDVDAERIAFASAEYPEIRFVQCAPQSTSFEDGSFDIVVSAVVIHFVPSARRYLAEIQRLLRPGGALVILCQNRMVLRDTVRRAFGKGVTPTTLWVPTMDEMKALLTESGFDLGKSTFFYDPPVEGWRNTKDYLLGGAKMVLSALRVFRTADYYGFVAHKRAP